MGHVVITGGSSGIGAALAYACLRRGDTVSLIARGTAQLESARDRLATNADAAWIFVHAADVSIPWQVAAAVAACESTFGPCDLLITSAGVVQPGRFEEQSVDDFNAQLLVNLTGTVNCVRAVYAGMKARGRGNILILGSGAGLIGIYGYTGYCASKYGLYGFAEALRSEAKVLGITVSICFPPDTETPQLAGERKLRPSEAEAMIARGGLWQPADVARIALAGMQRGRFAIYPGTQMKLLGRFGSLVMPFLRLYFDRKISAIRARSTKPR